MAITASDIQFFLSGGSGNTDPNASLGGAISSSTQLSGTPLHNLFDIVSSAEAATGESEYRCFYIKNAHGTLTLQNAKFWISTDSSGASSDVELALAGEGVNGTAETVANENTAPVGESFVNTAISEGAALSIGNIPAGQHQAVWVKRIIPASAPAATGVGVTFTVKGDTAA